MKALADFILSRQSEIYAEPISEGHSMITAAMAREVVKYLPAGASVLDIGCGQGPALEWFRQEGFYPIGVSMCPGDVKICEGKGFAIIQRDMHEIDLREVDCVWARHVLEHSIAPMFALHQWRAMLKDGGILYVEVPGEGTSCQHHTNPNHYSIFTSPVWQELIERSGFAILEARNIKLETGAGPDVYHSFIARKNTE